MNENFLCTLNFDTVPRELLLQGCYTKLMTSNRSIILCSKWVFLLRLIEKTQHKSWKRFRSLFSFCYVTDVTIRNEFDPIFSPWLMPWHHNEYRDPLVMLSILSETRSLPLPEDIAKFLQQKGSWKKGSALPTDGLASAERDDQSPETNKDYTNSLPIFCLLYQFENQNDFLLVQGTEGVESIDTILQP